MKKCSRVETTGAFRGGILLLLSACLVSPSRGAEEGGETQGTGETVHELSPLEVVDRPISEDLFDETKVERETVRREGLSKTVRGIREEKCCERHSGPLSSGCTMERTL